MEKNVLFKHQIKNYVTSFYRNCNEINDYEIYQNSINHKKGLFVSNLESKTTESCYLENYSNLMCSVNQINEMIVLEESGDKISLKLFKNNYQRNVGIRFFSKKKYCYFITVNKRTGDYYVGHILNYQNKIKFTKKIVKNPNNYVGLIQEQFSIIMASLGKNEDSKTYKQNVITQFAKELGFFKFPKIDFDLNNTFLSNCLIRYSLTTKNVKIPDNLDAFIYSHYHEHLPKSKILKKHNLKFIDAFMAIHGVSGSEIKKNLHICKKTNVSALKGAINYFGYDKIYSSNSILKLLNLDVATFFYNYPVNFATKEKNKFFNYYQWFLNGDVNSNTLNDHVLYYNQLTAYGENISLNAKNLDEFINEHANWSVLLSTYQKGYNVRSYNDKFVDKVQQPIFDFNGVEYTPVLLLTTNDYNDESAHQNNCVRTYTDKCASVIVSLRNNNERGTIEYFLEYDPTIKKITTKRVQCLGKFNRVLSESWNPVVEILDEQIKNAINVEKFNLLMKTTFVNNKTISKKMVISEPKNVNENSKYIGLVQWDNELKNNDSVDLDF